MREVIRGYRLKVKLIENEATAAIEPLFAKPVIDGPGLAALRGKLLATIRPQVAAALKEGGEFGKYLKNKM
jgi:hypothetical protein